MFTCDLLKSLVMLFEKITLRSLLHMMHEKRSMELLNELHNAYHMESQREHQIIYLYIYIKIPWMSATRVGAIKGA